MSRRTNITGTFQRGASREAGDPPKQLEWSESREPNEQKIVKLLSALIAASAIVVMAILAVASDEEQTATGTGDRGGTEA